MLATVQIYNPATASQEYDPETNTWEGSIVPLYEGKARIQPMSTNDDVTNPINPTFLKNVRVQIPYNKNTLEDGVQPMPDIRPNDKMVVTSSPYNEVLEKFVFVVVDVLNSSNAWERTLICRVDTELDPTETE